MTFVSELAYRTPGRHGSDEGKDVWVAGHCVNKSRLWREDRLWGDTGGYKGLPGHQGKGKKESESRLSWPPSPCHSFGDEQGPFCDLG